MMKCKGFLSASEAVRGRECAISEPNISVVQRHVGDLYVTYSVAFPTSLTKKQKATVSETFPPSTSIHEEL